MHDPKVVAHEIRRPWPHRSGLPATGTREDGVRWRVRLHHEHFEDSEHPGTCGGCDQPMTSVNNWFPWWKPGSYMTHWRLAGRDFWWPPLITIWHNEPGGRDALSSCSQRHQRPDGTWTYTRTWRWHVTHWSVQVHPLQHLRRFLLTRCAWCGGRSRKGNMVNFSNQWDGPRGRWWQGEPSLYHRDCLDREAADRTCTCEAPVLREYGPGTSGFGQCSACGRFRPWGITPERIAWVRELRGEAR